MKQTDYFIPEEILENLKSQIVISSQNCFRCHPATDGTSGIKMQNRWKRQL
jgi:hypothetical protein